MTQNQTQMKVKANTCNVNVNLTFSFLGHIFCNPIDPEGHMALICYKNGSLTREHVRNTYAQGTWDAFNQMLSQTPPGNNGNIAFYFVVRLSSF